MSRDVIVNTLVTDQFPIYDIDGYAHVSGLVQEDFDVTIYHNGSIKPSYSFIISEILEGEYRFRFTPNLIGYWAVVIGNERYMQWREGSFDVAEASQISDIYEMVQRTLGLVHENMFIDTTIYDSNGQLTSARIIIFASKDDAELATDGGSSPPDPVPIATYVYTAVWNALNQYKTFLQVRDDPT